MTLDAAAATLAPEVPLPATPATKTDSGPESLKILHILRAPVGGLFRHVIDLARAQIELGHRLGIIVDSTTGGAHAKAVMADLEPKLALGLLRVPTPRELSPADVPAFRQVAQQIALRDPDVLHGHGAKGAAFSRLTMSAPHAIRVYTPHGGSLIYSPGTLRGNFYRKLEWLLNWRTDLFLFESKYAADLFRAKIGRPRAMVRVVCNGIDESEFETLTPDADATDIVCIGELRPVKAIDVLLEAIAILNRSGRPVTATIAGEGPNGAELKAQAQQLGIGAQVKFIGFCPARKAFPRGRLLVIPSRAESLPYIVLEAAAAAMPMVCTNVGGIPEIFGPHAGTLIPPDDLEALTSAIGAAIDDPAPSRDIVQAVRTRVREQFSVRTMVEGVIASYREAIATRRPA